MLIRGLTTPAWPILRSRSREYRGMASDALICAVAARLMIANIQRHIGVVR
jgi:hypothetical protein